MTLRILVAYSMAGTHVATTWDYLLALKRHGGVDVAYAHVTHGAAPDVDLDGFDVVFHNYCARLCFPGYVSEGYRAALRQFTGLKVLAVQDEYDRTDLLKAAIRELGFQLVLTCVPASSIELVYPHRELPGVEFLNVLTGYVPDHPAARRPCPPPLRERRVAVGYRGRDIGARYGRLAYDKREIGLRMKAICAARGIAHDIAVDEASRLDGAAWYDFIAGCRTMLGTESGSNVFDFDGSIEREYRELAAAGGAVDYERFLPRVAAREGLVSMGQISPRAFECAALRTPMILFRGGYSGVLEPDRHYIPLEKDFSNVDAVLARLDRLDELEAMASRAYVDLVASGRYGYRAFAERLVDRFDRRIRELGLRPAGAVRAAAGPAAWAGDPLRRPPTSMPLDRDHFEVIHATQQIAILEPEVDRLVRVLEEAGGAYAERLAGDQARVETARPSGFGGTLTRLVDMRPGAAVALDRFERHRRRCRKRRAAWLPRRDVLWRRFQASAGEDAPAGELLGIQRERIGLLEAEIGLLNQEIDGLNALALVAIAAFEVIQATQQIAILEPEVDRLVRVLEEAGGAYAERLAGDQARIEAARSSGLRGTLTRLVDMRSTAALALGRFERHRRRCRKRRAAWLPRRDGLSRRLQARADEEAPAGELLGIQRDWIGLLEAEIRLLNQEIDGLNALALAAIAAFEGG